MSSSNRYSPEVRERAVRLVFAQRDEYESEWAAITSIATKFGCSTETLRNWVRKAERDEGLRPGVTSAQQEELKTLRREVKSSYNHLLWMSGFGEKGGVPFQT